MNNKVLSTLEYDKIIEMLAAKATCDAGAAMCRKLLPYNDLKTITVLQEETKCAFDRIIKFGSVSCAGITDLRPSMARLSLGSSLSIKELLAVANMLEVVKRAVAYGDQMEDATDALSVYFENLHPALSLLNEIRRCIIDEETIADDASSALSSIRRAMVSTNDKIKAELGKMLNNTTTRGYLQEAVITQRDGRYCLPVRNDYKTYVPGMVHDQSATGSTFFIEPMSVVNLNNELRELQVREQDEIERILANLSNMVADHSDEISGNFDILVAIDFIMSKGRLAVDMNGCYPHFNTDGIIKLKGARHPLLDKNKVVPIDITLGDEYNLLLITGPNTGGKTVSLKTCGLLTLMAQSGLHIPVKDQSTVAIFDDVYADIGDEQSIEQSLSTFSSHMTHLVHILDSISSGQYSKETEKRREETPLPFGPTKVLKATVEDNHVPQFLILLDELCAGTDPKEGAALAQSILDRLHTLDVRTMATTHYSELKMYAISTEGVENASCEFSLETLSPTYHLIIGIPGKSNAFAISNKLGLPEDLIENAKVYLSDNDISFEDLLVDIEQRRHQIEIDQMAIAKEKAEAERALAAAEEKLAKINESRERVLREANEKASNILQNAKDVADATIRDFNKYASGNADIAKMEAKRANLGKQLNATRSKSAEKAKPVENKNVPTSLRIGDKVKVLSMNLTGTVCSLPNNRGELQVQMGIMKSNVNIRDCMLIEEENPYAVKKGSKTKTSFYGGINKAGSMSTEINLLGCTVDEAIAKLEKYLDDAYISHLTSVRVVHGKGTGALRQGVHQYLKRQKNVADYHLAAFGEGDSGVTIVEFKQ